MKPFAAHNSPAVKERRTGASLIEVMYTILLLSILSVGGAAYLSHSRAECYAQLSRRSALEVANTRLEELYHADYNDISPLSLTFNTCFISGSPANWTVQSADPSEQLVVGSQSLPITTSVSYQDINGGSDSYDFLHIIVEVAYRANANDTVRQELYRGP